MRNTTHLWPLAILALMATATARAELTFSSAPRDSAQNEEQVYKPLMDLLTRATGQKVTFRYGENYTIYMSEMRKGSYDIVLDGPHFVSWRMAKLNHLPIVKFSGDLTFVTIVRKDQTKVQELKQLAGRTICAFPSPNLATLAVYYEFDNPARQPMTIPIDNFQDAYKGVVSGKCVGGILQAKLYQNMDKDAKAAKVLYTTKPLPNQAFSVGPRVTADMRDKITKALLSPEGAAATAKLREIYKVQSLIITTPDEYQGLGKLLRDTMGFEL